MHLICLFTMYRLVTDVIVCTISNNFYVILRTLNILRCLLTHIVCLHLHLNLLLVFLDQIQAVVLLHFACRAVEKNFKFVVLSSCLL